MSRKNSERMAAQAAAEASAAGRVLQARGQGGVSEDSGSKLEPSGGEGGDEKPDGWRPEPRNEPRRQAMEEIEQARERQRAAEAGTPPPAPPEQTPEPPVPTADQMLQGSKFATVEQPAEVPATTTGDETTSAIPPVMVKQKVDGVEVEVSQAEIDESGGERAWRIERAAKNRLEAANQALAETRRTQAAIAEWAKAQTPQKPVETDDQFIASKVDIIRFGTPEESAAALREVMSRQNPKVDPQAIVNQAVDHMNKQAAIEGFKKEFADIVANPIVLRAAIALEAETSRQFTGPVDWAQHYRTIGNQVRNAFGRQPQQTSVPAVQAVASTTGNPSQVPSEREARKATITNLPTAAARAALPAETKPLTREESLNELRRSRGIPTG